MTKGKKFESKSLFAKTEGIKQEKEKTAPVQTIKKPKEESQIQSISLRNSDFELIEKIRGKCRETGFYKCNLSQAVRIALRGIDLDKVKIEELINLTK